MTESLFITYKQLHSIGLWKNGGPILGNLDIELTERCNNKCIHCYINQDENDISIQQREMTTKRVKEIVSEAAGLGCMTIRYTGGEPLLRKDFPEIYMHTRKCGIKVILCTNATLLTTEHATLFKRYPLGNPIEITLYGMDEDSYRKIANVSNNFHMAMKGIKLLIESDIPFVLKGIRISKTVDEVKEMESFALTHCPRSQLPTFSMEFNLRARRDRHAKNLQIQKLRATPEEALSHLIRYGEDYLESQRMFAAKFMKPAGTKIFTCGCGKGGSVDAFGKFQPCLLLRHPDLTYDLESGSMQEALDTVFPVMREMVVKNQDYLRRCSCCFLHGLCMQCPAQSWMEHGTLDTPVEYYCKNSHAQAVYLGLLSKGEQAWEVTDAQNRIDNFTSSLKAVHNKCDLR